MRYLLFFSVIFISPAVKSQLTEVQQRKIDSLKTFIGQTKNDTLKILALSEWDNLIYFFDPVTDQSINEKIEKICYENLRKSKLNSKERYFFSFWHMKSLNILGLIYENKGDMTKAIAFFTNSLKRAEEIKNLKGIATAYINIGLLYNHQRDRQSAIQYYEKGLALMEQIGDKHGVGSALNNLGKVYGELKQNQKAITYFRRALKNAEEINFLPEISNASNNLANCLGLEKKIDSAIILQMRSLRIREKLGDKQAMANSLSNLGSLYAEKGDFQKAESYTMLALEKANEVGAVSEIAVAASALYRLYKKTGNNMKALEMHELHIRMRDSLATEESKKEVVRQEFKHAYEKKAAADSVLTAQEKLVTQARLDKERTQRLVLYGGLIITVVFSFFMFQRFRIIRKQKKIIEHQKHEVEVQKEIIEEKQKEVMDSIRYARRIQKALMPSDKYLDKSLKKLKEDN